VGGVVWRLVGEEGDADLADVGTRGVVGYFSDGGDVA
jgi:hypothetical protein